MSQVKFLRSKIVKQTCVLAGTASFYKYSNKEENVAIRVLHVALSRANSSIIPTIGQHHQHSSLESKKLHFISHNISQHQRYFLSWAVKILMERLMLDPFSIRSGQHSCTTRSSTLKTSLKSNNPNLIFLYTHWIIEWHSNLCGTKWYWLYFPLCGIHNVPVCV